MLLSVPAWPQAPDVTGPPICVYTNCSYSRGRYGIYKTCLAVGTSFSTCPHVAEFFQGIGEDAFGVVYQNTPCFATYTWYTSESFSDPDNPFPQGPHENGFGYSEEVDCTMVWGHRIDKADSVALLSFNPGDPDSIYIPWPRPDAQLITCPGACPWETRERDRSVNPHRYGRIPWSKLLQMELIKKYYLGADSTYIPGPASDMRAVPPDPTVISP